MTRPAPILVVDHLSVDYPSRRRGAPVRVVHDVELAIAPGETLGLVGESGSGKSTIGNAILGLAPCSAGRITLDGADISHLTAKRRRRIAGSLQAIFQDPYGSLNPALRVGDILTEPLRVNGHMTRQQAQGVVDDLLARVNLPADAATRYPSSFSGGQRQRIAIARAVSVNPAVIVCDEPTSSLDVSTQAQVLDLLAELRRSLGVAYLFITHDLALVRDFADRVAVLERGRIVECGRARDVCDHPTALYTQALMAAAPVPDPKRQRLRRAARQSLLERLRDEEGERGA